MAPENQNELNYETKTKKSSISFSNSNNSMDNTGVTHNSIIDSLEDIDINTTDTTLFEDTIKLYTSNIINSLYGSGSASNEDCINNVSGFEGDVLAIDFSDYRNLNSNISNISSADANLLADYIENIKDINISGMTITEIRDEMIDIEDDYIDNLGGDSELFKGFSAVMRYSSLQSIDQAHSGYDDIIVSGMPRWFWIALGDAAGFAVGLYVGGSDPTAPVTGLQSAAAVSAIVKLYLPEPE